MTPETELLEDRLRKIDVRLAALEIELTQVAKGSAPHAQLMIEQSDLMTLRRVSDLRLRTMLAPPSDKQLAQQRRRAALVARREIEIKEDWLRMADKWSREGDHYQSRLARMSALEAREQAEREFQ